MKFRCQNCSEKFSSNICNNEERKKVFCPKCNSQKLKFSGAGYIEGNHWELKKSSKDWTNPRTWFRFIEEIVT